MRQLSKKLDFAKVQEVAPGDYAIWFESGDLDKKDAGGRNFVQVFVERSPGSVDLDLLRKIVEAGCDVSCTDKDGHNVLWLAGEKATCELFEVLIEAGADINRLPEKGTDLVSHLWQFKPSDELLQLLIDKDLEVEKVSNAEASTKVKQLKNKPQSLDREKLREACGRDFVAFTEASSVVGGQSLLQAFIQECGETVDAECVKMICEAGVDVNHKDGKGENALWLAVEKKVGSEVIQTLLEAGCECNFKPSEGQDIVSLYCSTTEEADEDILKLIMSKGLDLELIENEDAKSKALPLAPKKFDFAKLKELTGGSEADFSFWHEDVKKVRDSNETLLIAYISACKEGPQSEALDLLKEFDVDFAFRNKEGNNALWAACSVPTKKAVFEAMIDHGANCDEGKIDLISHYCAQSTAGKRDVDPEVIKLFLDRGCSLDDIKDKSAKEIAKEAGKTKKVKKSVVEKLKDLEVDGDFDFWNTDHKAINEQGLTLLQQYFLLNKNKVKLEAVRLLCKSDIDVNNKDEDGKNVLWLCAQACNDLKVFKRLFKHKADCNFLPPDDQDLCSAYFLSCSENGTEVNNDIVKLFIESDLQADIIQDDGAMEVASLYAFEKQPVVFSDSEADENDSDEDKSSKDGDQNEKNEAQETIKNMLKEREEEVEKQVNKIYDSSYLRRLMRLVSVFTSVGKTRENAK